MKHATIKLGEYTIPLIGIRPEETELICGKCKKTFDIQQIRIHPNGKEVYCDKCLLKIKK